MDEPSWDDGTENRYEQRGRSGRKVVMRLTLICDDSDDDDVPEAEEIVEAVKTIVGVREVTVDVV